MRAQRLNPETRCDMQDPWRRYKQDKRAAVYVAYIVCVLAGMLVAHLAHCACSPW